MERIYKENWLDTYVDEKILGVEMKNGNKYYLAPNVDGFVPVNLKQHVECGYSDTTDLETGIRQCRKWLLGQHHNKKGSNWASLFIFFTYL